MEPIILTELDHEPEIAKISNSSTFHDDQRLMAPSPTTTSDSNGNWSDK